MEGLGDLDGKVMGGRYRLSEKLGQGGMGAVYAATQTSLGRRVAIKVLLPILSSDQGLIARFRGEAERAGRLNHPNIVQVLDFGQEPDGTVWIAMELLEGEALTDRIEKGPLSEAEAVSMAKAALAGLEAAHDDRLVHRDLKPDNIFLARAAGVGEVVKILDFGIAKLLDGDGAAKLTATGLIIGTPLYMSPEQARGEELDQRSDLYSLGAVIYEALTGRPPFTGRNYNALLVAVLTDTPTPIRQLRPDLSPELADIVMRALDKEPARRFASAAEMSTALSSFTPKTEKPPSVQALGLASTMATPEVGSIEPARPSTDTPVAGGVGTPQPTRPAEASAAAGVPASAPTAPMTEASKAEGPPRRRHGWLVGAMVAVALLAGVGGTYAFLGATSDAEPLAAAPPVTVTEVAPSEPGEPMAPVAPTTPVPTGGGGGEAATGTMEAEPAGEDGAQGDDAEDPEGSSDTSARAGMRRRPQRRAGTIQVSGGLYARHREHREHGLRTHGAWNSCWPPGMPYPDMNRGVSINGRTTADGALTVTGVRGSDLYPELSRCLIRELEGASLGPADDGQGHDVFISFSFYPNRPATRRR